MSAQTSEGTVGSSATDIVTRDFEAFPRHDLETIGECYAPDAVLTVAPLGVFRGREAIRDLFGGLFNAVPDLETEFEIVATSGDVAVVEWTMRGTFSGGEFQGIEPTGRRIEFPGADVVRTDGHHIVRNNAYYDGMTFARAIGMLPPQDSRPEKAMFAAFNVLTRAKRLVRPGA